MNLVVWGSCGFTVACLSEWLMAYHIQDKCLQKENALIYLLKSIGKEIPISVQ